MNTLMIAEKPMSDNQAALVKWFYDYADEVGLLIVDYSVSEVAAAVRAHLHESIQLDSSAESTIEIAGVHLEPQAESILDIVGIHLVFQHGSDRIALGGSTDESEVKSVFENHQQQEYADFRKALEIDYFWVLKLTNLSPSANNLFEVMCEFFDLEQKPDCCIVDL